MGRKSSGGFRLKILSKYDTITDFCSDIGVSRSYLYQIMSGDVKKFDNLYGIIKEKLGITDDELQQYITEMGEKKPSLFQRRKLKLKIKGTFGSISEFCRFSGISMGVINYICSCQRDGTYSTWEIIQDVLSIPDEEMWSYIKKEENTNVK